MLWADTGDRVMAAVTTNANKRSTKFLWRWMVLSQTKKLSSWRQPTAPMFSTQLYFAREGLIGEWPWNFLIAKSARRYFLFTKQSAHFTMLLTLRLSQNAPPGFQALIWPAAGTRPPVLQLARIARALPSMISCGVSRR